MKSKVGTYTSRGLTIIHRGESIRAARVLMRAQRIRHLPVVDDQQRVVGLISERDISDREDSAESVGDRMHFEVITIDEGNSVSEAASIMIAEKVSSLLVLKDEFVVGIITSEDLLRVLTEEHRGLADTLKTNLQSRIYNSPIRVVIDQLAAIGL